MRGSKRRRRSKNICFSKRRLHALADQPEQPLQGVALLSLRASINNVERQKQIPIADAAQQCGQTLLVQSALELELTPQREWLVVVLDHRQHVGVVAELGEERPRQRRMTVRRRDRRAALRLTLERVMGVNEQLELPVVRIR